MVRTIHPCGIVAAPHQGEPGVGILGRGHLWRHHSDNGENRVVKSNGVSNYARVAIEYALPKSITDYHDRGRADFVFIFAENSAASRGHTDDFEKI